MMSNQHMFLLFLENICLQQENITGHIDHPNANQSHGRQTQWGKAQWYPEYTCTDKDNAGLGMIWHESDLKRSDVWATAHISYKQLPQTSRMFQVRAILINDIPPWYHAIC